MRIGQNVLYLTSAEYLFVDGLSVSKLEPHEWIHQVISQQKGRFEGDVVDNDRAARRVAQEPVTMVPGGQEERKLGTLIDEIDLVGTAFLVDDPANPVLPKQQKVQS